MSSITNENERYTVSTLCRSTAYGFTNVKIEKDSKKSAQTGLKSCRLAIQHWLRKKPINYSSTAKRAKQQTNKMADDEDCQEQLTSLVEQHTSLFSLNSSSSSGSSSPTDTPSHPAKRCFGPKYKLISEGDLLVCRLNHTRTIISKIMNSKYLRRWEQHHIILTDKDITSSKASGFMEDKIPYSMIEDVNIVSRWDAGHRFCLRITIPDGSLLLQVINPIHLDYLSRSWAVS